MGGGELEAAAAAAWAEALGCDLLLLGEPGAHIVPGGAWLRGRNVVYMAEVRTAVLVYCPGRLRPCAAAVLASTRPAACSQPACAPGSPVKPRFSDHRGMGSPMPGTSRPLSPAPGVSWTAMIRCWPGCGRRAGRPNGLRAFADPDGVMYGIEEDGRLAAAGNLTRFRGYPADVGLLTHPAARGRGLARQIAVQMIGDALPAAGIIRYRALATNSPSLAIARSLGFAGYGQNLIARLPA